MIDPVTTQSVLSDPFRLQPGGVGDATIAPTRSLAAVEGTGGDDGPQKSGSFGDLITNLVQAVDAKGKTAEAEVQRLMLGESDNIHRSMIAMQESGVAFTLLVEVRNKLVESYQELMRMQV